MKRSKDCKNDHRGFSLIELTVASLILLVGVMSVASLIGSSITSNVVAKNDTVAVAAAERELERLKNLAFVSWVDGGSILDSTGRIDFSGSPVSGYSSSVSLTDSDEVGRTVTYDVRWNITSINAGMKKITVAAQRLGGNLRFRPAHLFFIKAP